jgi:hypothetical protein
MAYSNAPGTQPMWGAKGGSAAISRLSLSEGEFYPSRFQARYSQRSDWHNPFLHFLLLVVTLLSSSCVTAPQKVLRPQDDRMVKSILKSFIKETPDPLGAQFPADLNAARQALYRVDSPIMFRTCSKEQASEVKSVRFRKSALVCFSTNPKNKPDASAEFLADFDQNLQKALSVKGGFQLAGDDQAADAEVYVEVYCLHNGKGHADIVTASLLKTVLLTERRRDPAVAKCNVFILRPGTPQVLAAYSRAVVMDPITGDRLDPLANALARAVVAMLPEFRQEPK